MNPPSVAFPNAFFASLCLPYAASRFTISSFGTGRIWRTALWNLPDRDSLVFCENLDRRFTAAMIIDNPQKCQLNLQHDTMRSRKARIVFFALRAARTHG